MLFCVTVLGAPIPIFGVTGTPWVSALLRGGLIGYCVLIALFAGAEIVAPAAFLKWRAWMMEGGPQDLAQLGVATDNIVLGGDRRGYRRLRLFGAGLLIVGILFGAAIWWLFAVLGLA